MSYYILPKILNNITINVETQKEGLTPHISHSIFNYYREVIDLIDKLCRNETSYIFSNAAELSKIVNSYECIFSKVPGSKYSVSKIKPYSSVFYDFLEICQTLNIFDAYNEKNILSLHFGKNYHSTIECMNIIREEYDDVNFGFKEIDDFSIEDGRLNNIHFLFYECNSNSFIVKEKTTCVKYIKFIINILKKQKDGGCSIIKIDNLFYKPMIDIIYLLSSLYDKIYLIKPNTSNVTTCEKYIICKNFIYNNEKVKIYLEKLSSFLESFDSEEENICWLTKEPIPYYFLNKIEEANIIVGQQQLESLDLIVHILKNKNKEDKIETLRKINLQKCIHWCEKYKIPYNKFSEKANIFLSFFKNNNNEIGNEEGLELENEDGFELGNEDGFELGNEDGFEVGNEDGVKLGNEYGLESDESEIFNNGLIKLFNNEA